MISAYPIHEWEKETSPWEGFAGLLTGKGDGFLSQVINGISAAKGGSGQGGLIGLIMDGRKNRDDAKIKYGADVQANLDKANDIVNALGQYRKDDGTWDLDALNGNADVKSKLATAGLYNLSADNLTKAYNAGTSYNDTYGKYAGMRYPQEHKWSDYDEYQPFSVNNSYGSGLLQSGNAQFPSSTATINGDLSSDGLLNAPQGFPTINATINGDGQSNSDGTWKLGTNTTPDASQLMQAATQMDTSTENLPKRDSKLSEQSQEEGQKATQEAVKSGMEAANKGPGLLGSALKGAVLGALTGGSAWAGALNGAKNWGLGQLGDVGQLYGAYKGISDATKGKSGADASAQAAQQAQQAQNQMNTWNQFSFAQPTGYQMGNYGQQFMRNNGYGGLL